MFVDFIIKQVVEYCTRAGLIYTALFFGEKYVIEYLTKKSVDSFVFNSNRIFSTTDLSFNDFFIFTTAAISYILTLVILILWLL